ncbi:hypothetical protein TVAG_069780 [Trichomonas vaginalis G3]|uniref:DUF3447 domain-containing protein n=1 Tax=Trichomonas vaginalis (strain ATCC PRA-98 / G3) TaxID=412133 RepID=A2ESM0_TRIV3|nr:spectrin binding [Trichomonas vaginalis G3]EAY04329.1 hypothetical protein TVAG_069780 [Trichomonas vaginalis G3]KAI5551903.1 spectrin binding [Trichomonas vaginalis G3]|eukprot:XP_001316552.1 hypothetical protein [Trichomonas vaginalis G3]
MPKSKRSVNATECDFNDMKPIEVFKYPSQTSKIICDVNTNNLLQISSQIIDLVKTNKVTIQMVLYLIDAFSQIRVKEVKLFTELYLKLSNEFSCIIQPRNEKLAALLHYQGLKFENFEPKKKEEEILNIYSTESPLYYIVCDKVDDLKSKFPDLDLKQMYAKELTSFDCAIKYGSELCFNYLKNLGAKYTDYSVKYAVQGGNQNIFMQMIEDGKSFHNMINTALIYRHYEIAEYLKTNFEQTPSLTKITKSMYFGNYDVVSYLISNGADINELYIFLHVIFINALYYLLSSQIYQCFMLFCFFSYFTLLYRI